MTPRPLLWNSTAWACTTLLAVLIVAWVVSLPLVATAVSRTGYGGGVSRGRLIINCGIWADRPLSRGTRDYHVVPLRNEWTFDGMLRGPGWTVAVPLWCPAALAAGATLAAWRMARRARRATLGACPKCNYPRTGLAPFAPCPECGAPAPMSRPSAERAAEGSAPAGPAR